MKYTLFIFLYLVFSCSFSEKNETQKQSNEIQSYVEKAQDFCVKNGYNTNFFIFIDMKIHSGKNRFYIWDFKLKKSIYKCLVSHGSCDVYQENNDYTKAKFSFKDGSHCTALGKYRIGEKGSSSFGMGVKFLMHGLDKANANALQRDIVFHSFNELADKEIYPNAAVLSWGCPAVSNNSLRFFIDLREKQSNKKILMWIVG